METGPGFELADFGEDAEPVGGIRRSGWWGIEGIVEGRDLHRQELGVDARGRVVVSSASIKA